jgi:5-methylcytosine-specific restriction protein A
MRGRLFSRQPLCVQCKAQGLATVATIRDHVIPLAEGGLDDETNEQALCQSCSDTKTDEEARRGRRRLDDLTDR